MWRCVLCLSILILLAPPVKSQTQGDKQLFTISPSAPPIPALKYSLLVDPADQQPGNAAVYYRHAESSLGKFPSTQADDFDSKDYTDAEFPAAAERLFQKDQLLFQDLDAAARCEQCDWQIPLRQKGFNARLPYLNGMRSLARLIRIRARELRLKGEPDQAIATLRVGYELVRKTGQGEFLVSGLVARGIATLLNGELIALLNQPEAPNLYWAMTALPRPMFSLHRDLESERIGFALVFKEVIAANLDDFSGDDLRRILRKEISVYNLQSDPVVSIWNDDGSLASAVDAGLPDAQRYYAQSRRVPISSTPFNSAPDSLRPPANRVFLWRCKADP